MRWAIVVGLLLAATVRADELVLHLASERGIKEVTQELKPVRVVTKTGARWPRYVDGKKAILFFDSKMQLRRVELAPDAPSERVVGKLPRTFKACKAFADVAAGQIIKTTELSVQDAGDFTVSRDSKHAYVTLQDRNINMVSVQIEFDVDLETGKVEHDMIFPECSKKKDEERPSAAATTPTPSEPPPATKPPEPPPYSPTYDVDGGWVVKLDASGGKKKVSLLGDDFSIGTKSGRWAVVRGNTSEGDYIHSEAYLFDRTEGKIYALAKGKARRVTPKAIRDHAAQTADTVGESTIEWLSPTLLQVDQLLVVPGVGAKEMAGDLAR